MRLDAHQHFWQLDRGDYGWLKPHDTNLYRDFLAEDLRPLLARYSIVETLAVQAAPSVEETQFLLQLAKDVDFVSGVVGWVDLESTQACEQIDALADDSYFLGVRPMIEDIADPAWMLGDVLAPALAHLAERQLTFDALVHPRHLRPLHQLLEQHRNLRVVIDHAAKPNIAEGLFNEWSEPLAEIAHDFPNCFCKLSGLLNVAGPDWTHATLKPYVDRVIDLFGPERVMWGSDWPVLNRIADYHQWMAVTGELLEGYSESELNWIQGDTARHVYRLP